MRPFARWFADRRGWFAVVIPYLAICATVIVALGVLNNRIAVTELRADQATVAAELAAHANTELTRAQYQSCLDRHQARADLLDLLHTISVALPERVADRITQQVQDLPPITC